VRRVPSKRVYVSRAVVFVAMLALCVVWFMSRQPNYFDNPTLVASTPQDRASFSARHRGGPTLLRPVWKLNYRWHPDPIGTVSFPVGTNLWSIQGVLNECQDVSGTQYFIDRNVAAGTIHFGTNNVLNGPQWVAALTNALQTGHPEWLNKAKGGFQHENLVFIPAGLNGFLVLPKERIGEFHLDR
jgi:hypothetical protein